MFSGGQIWESCLCLDSGSQRENAFNKSVVCVCVCADPADSEEAQKGHHRCIYSRNLIFMIVNTVQRVIFVVWC